MAGKKKTRQISLAHHETPSAQKSRIVTAGVAADTESMPTMPNMALHMKEIATAS